MGIDSGHPARGWSRRMPTEPPAATGVHRRNGPQKARLAEDVWKMLIHLPIIILTSLHPNPIADTVPIFDIARECQYEGGSKEEEKRCADDETRARDTLQMEWIQFTENAKRQCYEETSTDGTPSYVEFLTCLEMERDVRNQPK